MIILVGASASGKTEVAKYLSHNYGIKKVVTHTTRAIRKSEIPDVDYHFVDIDTFLKLKSENAFVETTFYNGNYYGTSKAEIGDEKCLIVDPNGVKAFQALHDDHIITFLLLASEKKRQERMEMRGDNPCDIQKRITADRVSFDPSKITDVDFIIDTNDLTLNEVADKVISLYRKQLA